MKKEVILWLLIIATAILLYGLADPAKFPFPKCPFRSLTGLLCPGCGSQRGLHQLFHGHFVEVFKLNALLIPALLYGLTAAVIRMFFPKYWPVTREHWYGKNAAYVALVIILGYWFLRNVL